jgi:UDP-glucose 4-epimerase
MALRVAVTGSETFFGRGLVRALEAEPSVERLLALDARPPREPLTKAAWHKLDLVHPRSAEQLAKLLSDEGVDAVVHTAFLARPTHRGGWAHELEAIGTRHVLAALEAARVRKLLLRSSTLVYGALPTHPNLLKESTPLLGAGHSAFIADKVEVEEQVARFAQKHPARLVTILRFAPLLGRGADTLATLYLRQEACPTLLGHDPLVQLLHPEDAVEATRLALLGEVRGAVNVAAPGVMPLSHVIGLSGGRRVPVPSSTVRSLARVLWAAQLGRFPPGMVDFLRYLCVADLTRMTRDLGFAARHDLTSTILAAARDAN